MKIVQIDRPAVWRAIRNTDLDIQMYTNYRYLGRAKMILEASAVNPVFRYAKNISVGDKEVSLLMVSHEKDAAKIEKYLEEVSKKVTDEHVENSVGSNFTYLDDVYGGTT